MFKKLPVLLLVVIVFFTLTHSFIPVEIKSFIYSTSLAIKTCLVFLLPFLIFLLLFKTASQMTKGATTLILFILSAVVVSNFLSTFSSFAIGSLIHGLDISLNPPCAIKNLQPMWELNVKPLISNSTALISGTITGILATSFKLKNIGKLTDNSEKIIQLLLKIFLFTVPIFVSGFILKLAHDGVLSSILKEYALIFSLVALSQIGYVCLIYLVANKFDIKLTIKSIKNILPAALVGFGSMSSAAAMPLTLIGAEKNAQSPDVAKSCIPATVNIHLIGDCLAIPIFAFAILKNFSIPCPSFATYSLFAIYFVLAKFSVAAIPGGGIIVMLPILESQLGFTPEMLSLITALYILFDPVITTANILGNGAFSQFIDKLSLFLKRLKTDIVSAK